MGDGEKVGKDKAATVIAYTFSVTPRDKSWTMYIGCRKTKYWIAITRIVPDARQKTFKRPENNFVEDRTIGVARSILSTRHLCRATVSAHLGRRELLLGFTRIAELGPESTNRLASFRGKVQALADMIELGLDSGGYLEWFYADLGIKTNYHRLTVRLESSRHPCCSWSFGLKAAHEVGGIALFLENLHIQAMMLFQNSL
ncbi:unnamed protein product [Umbelopsis ramanniana]